MHSTAIALLEEKQIIMPVTTRFRAQFLPVYSPPRRERFLIGLERLIKGSPLQLQYVWQLFAA